jgi:hypothetical protein
MRNATQRHEHHRERQPARIELARAAVDAVRRRPDERRVSLDDVVVRR